MEQAFPSLEEADFVLQRAQLRRGAFCLALLVAVDDRFLKAAPIPRPKVREYESVISQMSQSQFQRHFRLTRNVFEEVLEGIRSSVESTRFGRTFHIPSR